MHQSQVNKNPASVASAGVMLAGIITYVAAIDRDRAITSLAVILIVTGVFLCGTQRVLAEIRRVNRPADDAFSEGYESGYDRGWRDGNETPRPSLVVLPAIAASAEFADSCGSDPQEVANSVANQ